MGIKYVEYSKKFHEGLFPGKDFAYVNVIDAEDARETERLEAEKQAHASETFVSVPAKEKQPTEMTKATAPGTPPSGLATRVDKIESEADGHDAALRSVINRVRCRN